MSEEETVPNVNGFVATTDEVERIRSPQGFRWVTKDAFASMESRWAPRRPASSMLFHGDEGMNTLCSSP